MLPSVLVFGLACSAVSGVYSLYMLRRAAAAGRTGKVNDAEKKVEAKKVAR